MSTAQLSRPAGDALPVLLEPIVGQHIPGAERIVNWRAAERGFSTETFLLDAAGAAGQPLRSLVFRRPPEVALFPDYDIARQALAMNRLADTPIPVPKIAWLDRGCDTLGTPYLVMEHMPNIGTTGDFPSYHTAGMYFDATEDQRAKMWWGCVDTIAAVHALDWQALRLDKLLMPARGSHPLQQVVNYYRDTLQWATGGNPHPVLAAAVDWLVDNVYEPEHVSLCWGDSRLSNILYGPDFDVAAVVDWECAYIGDHEADLAWMLFTDWSFSEQQEIPRLPGTPSREDTIARYEELTGWQVRNLRYNEVLAAIALGCPVLRMQSRLRSQGLLTEDFDLAGFCVQRIQQLL